MKKYKVGITFGAFDLFHYGHLELLRRAKDICDILVVGVSGDEYIKEHKGKTPVIPYKERSEIVKACKYVDVVLIQDYSRRFICLTKKELCESAEADVLIVGDDWKGKTDWDGYDAEIPILFLKRTEGISTTDIIKRIKDKE